VLTPIGHNATTLINNEMIMTYSINKKFIYTLLVGSLCMVLNTSYAAGRFKAKGATTNANGGITAARAGAAKGANGGGFARARGTTTNGQGQASGGGATAVKGPNGGGGVRAGAFTADNSGNVNYQGGAGATGANGSAATTGGFSRSAGGGIVGGRATTATNSTTGNTYDGNTSYQSGQGVEHSQTCYNANKEVIACPND
jgi:hypothetical protein